MILTENLRRAEGLNRLKVYTRWWREFLSIRDKHKFDGIDGHGAKAEGQGYVIEYHAHFFILGFFDVHWTQDEQKYRSENLINEFCNHMYFQELW